MSYFSAFKIKDTSEIKIPSFKIKEFELILLNREIRLNEIDAIDEDELKVKEYKKLIKEKDELKKPFIYDISNIFKITNNYTIFSNFYEKGKYMFYFEKNKLSVLLEEGETFEFVLKDNFYIGDGEFYSNSNYGWTKDMIVSIIKEFKFSAIIEDMGDEEYGFVYADGCDRKLNEPEVWKYGVLC